MFYQEDVFGRGLLEGAHEILKQRNITDLLEVGYQRNDVAACITVSGYLFSAFPGLNGARLRRFATSLRPGRESPRRAMALLPRVLPALRARPELVLLLTRQLSVSSSRYLI
jgi:hypothetical protein